MSVHRGLYFSLFEARSMLRIFERHGENLGLLLAYAQVTTFTATCATYPFDTLRRRLAMKSPNTRHLNGAFEGLVWIVEHEGFRSLCRG
mmetsp:Transcript_17851/g.20618  ORF Transcript_17851/g.20618 Transcript_17851/m.20618 type:complete len:89 (+) Transcript_17851:528-794(+)